MSAFKSEVAGLQTDWSRRFSWPAPHTLERPLSYIEQCMVFNLPLVLSDILSALIVVCVSAIASLSLIGDPTWTPMAILTAPLTWCGACWLQGLYPGVGMTPSMELRQTTKAIGIITTLAFLTIGLLHPAPTAALVVVAAAALLLLPVAPVHRRMTRRWAATTQWWRQPVVILGKGRAAAVVHRKLRSNPQFGLRPVAIYDPGRLEAAGRDPIDLLPDGQQGVYWAIVATESTSHERLVRDEWLKYPHVLYVPSTEMPTLWSGGRELDGLQVIHLRDQLAVSFSQAAKRLLDILVVSIAAVFVLSLVVCIVILIKCTSRGPAFYSQRRIGRGGKHFRAWKLRTMVPDADQVLSKHLDTHPAAREEWDRDHKLKHDPRVTWIGRFLRKTSLDELPQLWNVVRGEMSLVGPRPIVDDEIEKYGDTYRRYQRVLPGITGLWQVSGRNNTSYAERVAFDQYYVCNWSIWLDLHILLRTVRVVLLREGAY